MSDEEGVLLYAWRGCLFRVTGRVQPPKAGSLFFCRHLPVRPGERVLEIGSGLGLAAVLAARAGARVVATDVVPEAVAAIRQNAALNGVEVDARLGDCYAPVSGERFDLVCTNPPQMPTPPERERDDGAATADNGGLDGWSILDRVIDGLQSRFGCFANKALCFTQSLIPFSPDIWPETHGCANTDQHREHQLNNQLRHRIPPIRFELNFASSSL